MKMLTLLFGLSILIALIDPILSMYLYQQIIRLSLYVRKAWKR